MSRSTPKKQNFLNLMNILNSNSNNNKSSNSRNALREDFERALALRSGTLEFNSPLKNASSPPGSGYKYPYHSFFKALTSKDRRTAKIARKRLYNLIYF